jgi:hypothetical protein
MALPEPSEQQDVPGIIASQRSPRMNMSEIAVSTKARLLPGGDVDVLNVSETGILVEGRGRPVVGTLVSIRIKGSRLRKLEGKILRSRVSTIHRDGTLSYESAIEFDHSHDMEDLVGSADEGAPSLSGDVAPAESTGQEVYVIDTDNDW